MHFQDVPQSFVLNDFKVGLETCVGQGMPPLPPLDKEPLIEFLQYFPRVLKGAFPNKFLIAGWAKTGAIPLSWEAMAKQCKGWGELSAKQQASVVAALPALLEIAKFRELTDVDMRDAIGFQDTTRPRDGLPLHQRRCVWWNSDTALRDRIVEQVERAKDGREEAWRIRKKGLAVVLNKCRTAMRRVMVDTNAYCYCVRTGVVGVSWGCEGRQWCPFRGYIHKDCSIAMEEEQPSEDEDYHCFFCKQFPKEVKQKKAVAQKDPANYHECIGFLGDSSDSDSDSD